MHCNNQWYDVEFLYACHLHAHLYKWYLWIWLESSKVPFYFRFKFICYICNGIKWFSNLYRKYFTFCSEWQRSREPMVGNEKKIWREWKQGEHANSTCFLERHFFQKVDFWRSSPLHILCNFPYFNLIKIISTYLNIDDHYIRIYTICFRQALLWAHLYSFVGPVPLYSVGLRISS